jgi:hypothetical protein
MSLAVGATSTTIGDDEEDDDGMPLRSKGGGRLPTRSSSVEFIFLGMMDIHLSTLSPPTCR